MIPLYTSGQIREADKYAIEKLNIPGIILMENAAKGIYQMAMESYYEEISSGVSGIICGKGNNGGDGFALARHIANGGSDVIVMIFAEEDELKGDALINYRIITQMSARYNNPEIIFVKEPEAVEQLSGCNVVFDCLLGTGTKGEIKEPYSSVIKIINHLNFPVIAVDNPSGLNSDTGSGQVSFEADLTITLGGYKRGLFIGDGYINCGDIKKASIGMGEEYFNSLIAEDYLVEPEDVAYAIPERIKNSHKYNAGKVFSIAGSSFLPGAAFLTANTVLKSGAGASVLAFPSSLKNIAFQRIDNAVVHQYNDREYGFLIPEVLDELSERIAWSDISILGPGLGREKETVETIKEILKNFPEKLMLLDADVFYSLREKEYKKFDLSNKILTPHTGEFIMMTGLSNEDLGKDILDAGKNFVSETDCWLLLKGAPSILFNPEGEAIINSSGNSGLSKFGTGDVLSGLIGSFAAQGAEPEEAVYAGMYIHGLSADLLKDKKTEYGFTATDVMENIPSTIKFIQESVI